MEIQKNILLELKAGEVQIFDPKDLLKECIIFFAFPKSRSSNFPIALNLAQAATAYGEQDVGGKILYWAGFTKSLGDIQKASELLRLAGGWVGSITRINGHKVSHHFNAYFTLRCYETALQCSNPTAHCHKIIDDPHHPNYDSYSHTVKKSNNYDLAEGITLEGAEDIKEFIFPCKKMLEVSAFHPKFKFERMHNVSDQDQIQAAAVEYGISICPFFNATSFKEIGSRKIK